MQKVEILLFSLLALVLSEGLCSSILTSLTIQSDLIDYYEPDALSCRVGYFMCNDTRLCIAQKLNCDSKGDCYDGSDEWNCSDSAANLFWDSLYRKNVKAVTDDIPWGTCHFSFADYPLLNSTCQCKLHEIHCQFENFVRIPSPLPGANITLLDLSGNRYPQLSQSFLQTLPSAEKIVLKHCSVETLDSNTFERFRGDFAEYLFLDQNKIEILPAFLFPSPSNLKTLVLSGNHISDIRDNAFANLPELLELDLRDNRLYTIQGHVLGQLRKLQSLFLNSNRLQAVTSGMIPPLPELQTLHLADNQIRYIADGALSLPTLQHLFLSGNQLTEIGPNLFLNLPNLIGLNLNDNEIMKFHVNAFSGNPNITSMYLTGNPFTTLDPLVLVHLNRLQHIYFSRFHLCRAASHVRVCEPHGDGISSAKHLLDNPLLRGSVWVMATIGIFGNILVLFGRLLESSRAAQAHAEHSLYLRHLAASDLLMGVYLAIIASADILFRGNYLAHEESWRLSTVCAMCGFLSTLSCQSSTLLLTMVTWDRLMSVTRPLQPRPPNKIRAIFRLGFLWSVSCAAAAAPLSATNYFGSHFYGTNGVCLSLHIHDPYAKGWEYSAVMFICVNTVSLLFIGASYIKMLRAIKQTSAEAMRPTLSGRENIVARRFAVIVATDCACWLPIIIVKMAALTGIKISSSLYAWLAVLVLPVNSALNPVLYTLTTTAFKQQIMRFIFTCFAKRRRQNGFDSANLSLSLGHFQNQSSRKLLQRRVSNSTSICLNNNNRCICTKVHVIHPTTTY